MSRAICIPFHRYQPHSGDYYKVWFQSLLDSIKVWKDEFNRLYIIDSDWGFDQKELNVLVDMGVDYYIIPRQQQGHHWVQFKTAMPRMKEDYVLFLDNDVAIWKKGIVDKWFKEAESGKFVTAFDGSGGLEAPVWDTFPILKAMGAHRMGSYYFILNKAQRQLAMETDLAPIYFDPGVYIKELDYTTVAGDWVDSFGLFTFKMLTNFSETYVIDDDRSSIYLQKDDNSKWVVNKDPESPKQLGYYHVRNGNLPIYLLSSRMEHPEDYAHCLAITPHRELLRILAWWKIQGGKSFGFETEVRIVLAELGLDIKIWNNYIEKFREYHGL